MHFCIILLYEPISAYLYLHYLLTHGGLLWNVPSGNYLLKFRIRPRREAIQAGKKEKNAIFLREFEDSSF